jgi:hypothetical membrane protein
VVSAYRPACSGQGISFGVMISARAVSIVGFVVGIGFVVNLHVLRTDLPPAAHRLSEYATGPHGWMMTTSFVALGCGLIALGVSLRSTSLWARNSWAIPALAFLAGSATILSGIFQTGASTTEESIHSFTSAIAVVAVVMLALAYSSRRARRRSSSTPDAIGLTLAGIAFALAALSPLLHHTRWTGLGQRALWIVLIAWLLRTAWIDAPASPTAVLVPRHGTGNSIGSRPRRTSESSERGG